VSYYHFELTSGCTLIGLFLESSAFVTCIGG
jgi:hypothetical protein